MTWGATMTEEVFDRIREHLIRADGQEDLCFALWHPANGARKTTALILEPILPREGDRMVHGNASFAPQYFERALRIASEKGAGLAFLHSHPYPGWQSMSDADVRAELSHAPAALGATGRPLVGLTIGTDGSLSARFWNRMGPRKYERAWCESVRIVGLSGVKITYNDNLIPPIPLTDELERTVSAWGQESQQNLSRIRVGIVGLGSVGASVAEALARIGMDRVSFIDFDRVERHNLDRHVHATRQDLGQLKVEVVKTNFIDHSSIQHPSEVSAIPYGVTEDEGYRAALDCDVIFSCVDRPWARHVLNFIAFANLIPVFDGGILVHTKRLALHSADWRAHAILPGKRCLACLGQYAQADVQLEREGLLDDPVYIASLKQSTIKNKQNVYAFSAHLASMLTLQFLSFVLQPNGVVQTSGNCYHFVTGTCDLEEGLECSPGCLFPALYGLGEDSGYVVTGKHTAAEACRNVTQV